VLSGNELQMQEIKALSELPSLEVLRAKMLALFNTPAQQLVRVLNAVPQGLLNVLQAKSQKES
jgi:large subunit ribosomal protein L10